ncbi:MAG TPA: MEKHLA domain-containing protein [Rhodocyclaceae bacterium]|nr:MEKHLA domain-containing protein [Rhodocyclaceae bacterium]HNB77783.1 MEKHLA domain-containing protein [Rhodocyclaceae bacterium]HNC62442.1 MEKHLA domain-containing protein [Rhodocyclaceae bacterium]HNH14306.1 MEKHLA domain-containing protein [Rhodocyclaceae bacterium]HNH97394.1 MEKHLA domain-containing protein [Rhodocyclaceae bacterium]
MPHASSEAAPDAAWLQRHVARLRESYRRLTGRDLISPAVAAADAPAALDAAPFGIVSHGTQADPLFNYANRCALALFAMDWAGFTRLPSRYSAPTADREARAQLLARVAANGFADDYRGLRVAADGRRFVIEDTTIWNVTDENGQPAGQAARIGRWHDL